MSAPKRQHFIPRSYLNNFARQVGQGKFFISAADKGERTVKSFSTKDICVEKNLYTLPVEDEGKKFALEHFYGDNIDGVFPEISAILKDRTVPSLSFETRLKVINVALSLYFRTPKFLNAENALLESLVNEAAESNAEFFEVDFLGRKYRISRNEVDAFIKAAKEENRIRFLSGHMIAYEKLVAAKLKDKITVYHIVDDSEFVISDNPVIIRPYVDVTAPGFDVEEYLSRTVDPFDPLNMIHLPIDAKTILTILPADGEEAYDQLHRMEITQVDTLMYNSDQENNAERWIMGSEAGVAAHFENMERYNEDTPENHKMIEDYQKRTIERSELLQLMEQFGARSEQVKQKVKEMKEKEYNSSDPNFKSLVDRLGI